MNYYIFDRETEKLLIDDDGDLLIFESNASAWLHLRNNTGYKKEFINKNFFAMRGEKLLEVEEMELKEDKAQQSRENCPVKLICQCGADPNWDGYCKMVKADEE